MRIDILTVLPEILRGPLDNSIIKRAIDKDIAKIVIHDIRDYGKGKYRQVDDYPFGGDAGMVLMIEPIFNIITNLKRERKYDEVIYLSPDGEIFDQMSANRLSCMKSIILLCGHYKGIDHRIRENLITKEISIGDFVLSGGELPAAVLCDAVVRILPGAIGDESSALSDSFQDSTLAPPIYTRPAEFNGWRVPEVLLSGNHKLIEEWRERESVKRTKLLRPNLIKKNYDQ